MKKNLLTVLILATNIVTIAMVGFMMLSVMSNVNKSTAIINDIAAAIELEQAGGLGGGIDPSSVNTNVALSDRETYSVNEGNAMNVSLTINPTENGGDGRQHYAQVTMQLLMDKTNPDYDANASLIAGNDQSIVSIVYDVIGSYTYEYVADTANRAVIKQEILSRLWNLFGGTTFIFDLNLVVTPA